MPRATIQSDGRGHHHIPIRLHLGRLSYDGNFFYDTGATYCSVPRSLNDLTLHLPIVGRDEGIETANGVIDLDYVQVPRMQILRPYVKIMDIEEEMITVELEFRESGIIKKDVKCWLCEEDESFVVGTNFFSGLDRRISQRGELCIRC